MSTARFTVAFTGESPDQMRVGDKLTIGGTVTVQQIRGDLVDITAMGNHPEFTLGELSVDLVANWLEVTP